MAELHPLMRRFALALVRAACACACLLPLSCAFGDADAVQSLFEDNEDPLFVAAGSEAGMYALYTSPTGSSWSRNMVRVGEAGTLYFSLYGSGLFLSAGSPSNFYASTDGFAWGKGNTGGGAVVDTLFDGAYGNGRFVVVGNDSTGAVITYASEDGIAWVKGNLDLSYMGSLNGVTYANGMFVAVGYESAAATCLVVSSADGIVWTKNLRQFATSLPLYDIAYGNGMFVAVGGSGVAMVSPDGVTWTRAFYIGGDLVDINGIAWGGDRFVAVGNPTGLGYSGIYVSEDGLAWSDNVNRGSGGTSILEDVVGCHGYFVAVSFDGIVLYSSNGLSWNTRSLPGGPNLYGVACRP